MLKHPTLAQQAVNQFRNATKTISLAVIAKRLGAEKFQHFTHTEHVFDDGSSLEVRGRGRSHKVEVLLP
jgi:hypothetical protein